MSSCVTHGTPKYRYSMPYNQLHRTYDKWVGEHFFFPLTLGSFLRPVVCCLFFFRFCVCLLLFRPQLLLCGRVLPLVVRRRGARRDDPQASPGPPFQANGLAGEGACLPGYLRSLEDVQQVNFCKAATNQYFEAYTAVAYLKCGRTVTIMALPRCSLSSEISGDSLKGTFSSFQVLDLSTSKGA